MHSRQEAAQGPEEEAGQNGGEAAGSCYTAKQQAVEPVQAERAAGGGCRSAADRDQIACREELFVCIAKICKVAGRDLFYTKGSLF